MLYIVERGPYYEREDIFIIDGDEEPSKFLVEFENILSQWRKEQDLRRLQFVALSPCPAPPQKPDGIKWKEFTKSKTHQDYIKESGEWNKRFNSYLTDSNPEPDIREFLTSKGYHLPSFERGRFDTH